MMKKLLYIIFPALVPFIVFPWLYVNLYTDFGAMLSEIGLIPPFQLIILVAIIAITCFVSTVIAILLMIKRKIPSTTGAKLVLILKVLQIPVHVICSLLGYSLLIWYLLGLFFFAINFIMIVTSGSFSCYAIVKARLEGKISTASAVIRIIFSFVFVLDVFFAVSNYIKLRMIKRNNSAST